MSIYNHNEPMFVVLEKQIVHLKKYSNLKCKPSVYDKTFLLFVPVEVAGFMIVNSERRNI